MNSILSIAVLGAGRIGSLHAANVARYLPGARLHAVADVNAEAARHCAALCGAAHAYGDVRAALDDTQVDAVLICSSTDTHAPLIEDAAAAGKHIFCEKPIAHDLPTIDRALAAVARAGVLLQIGFNRRFDAGFRHARDAVAAGELGPLELVRITSRDPAPPPLEYVRRSGGLFLDMTIHDFDMARFLTGDEAVGVFATGAALVDPAIGAAGDIDTAAITLRMASGALVTIDNSRRAVYGYDQRVEVFGARGALVVSNSPTTSAVRYDAAGAHAAPLPFFFVERYEAAYRAELAAFVESLRTSTPPAVSGADGRAPVVLALAAQRALAERREVAVSEVDGVASAHLRE